MLSKRERSQRARIAAHAMHAQHDPVVTSAKARQVFAASFLEQVDPTGELRRTNPAEAERRAESARKAHFARLAFASAKARRARKARSQKPPEPGVVAS